MSASGRCSNLQCGKPFSGYGTADCVRCTLCLKYFCLECGDFVIEVDRPTVPGISRTTTTTTTGGGGRSSSSSVPLPPVVSLVQVCEDCYIQHEQEAVDDYVKWSENILPASTSVKTAPNQPKPINTSRTRSKSGNPASSDLVVRCSNVSCQASVPKALSRTCSQCFLIFCIPCTQYGGETSSSINGKNESSRASKRRVCEDCYIENTKNEQEEEFYEQLRWSVSVCPRDDAYSNCCSICQVEFTRPQKNRELVDGGGSNSKQQQVDDDEDGIDWGETDPEAAGFGADPREVATIRSCDHFFHAACLLKWTKIEQVCPICREKVA